jgi:hypothetical protein
MSDKAVQPAGVIETKRKIVFESGHHLNLRNVTDFNAQGTYLRIKSDEGYILVNPDKVLYHIATVNGAIVS